MCPTSPTYRIDLTPKERDKTMKLNIEPTTFRRALGVIPFAPKDDYTPILAGVCIERNVNQLTFYATDRYKAARVTIPVEADTSQFRVIVEAKMFAAAVKALAPLRTYADTLTLEVSEEAVRITNGTQAHELRTMEGEYPPMDKFFHQDHGNVEEIILAPAALKALADSARSFGKNAGNYHLKFTAPDKPVIATMPLDDNVTFEAVIMPIHKF